MVYIFGLRQLIQEELKGINKGHPAVFANIIQSQGCSSMNADTPNLEAIQPPCVANFMKNRISMSYKINKKNFIQEFLFFYIIPPDEDNEVENCMANKLGHVT